MSKILIFILLPIVILGCSNPGGISLPDIKVNTEASATQDNHWSWGVWEFRFNEDHTQVEAVPQRGGQYHYCVTKLMEEYPCVKCLTIGKPAVQPDGTVKLDVTMKHPFPAAPKYTGFDVRGMVYFPPTEVHETLDIYYLTHESFPDGGFPLLPDPYTKNLPLIFSRAAQGGGELLNFDGYSCYLLPGVAYSTQWPIFSYSPPKHSNEPAPFSTINPYKLFASDAERRMFLVTDKITREYHFALPPGPFNFGYAVDASWWPPTTTPVTNPAVDFPREANAEDPWLMEYEQLLPVCEENAAKDIFKVTIHHRGGDFVAGWVGRLWFWDLSTDCPQGKHSVFVFGIFFKIDDFTVVGYGRNKYSDWWQECGDGIVPGHHFAVLTMIQYPDGPDSRTELRDVIAPCFVDVYVEG